MTQQGRGQLTERVRAKAVEMLGREITVTELRLMPYVAHCAQNNRFIDLQKVNKIERGILAAWQDDDWITGTLQNLTVSHEFWTAIAELIYLAYVDLSDAAAGAAA